jgi:hypothetical protein
MRTLSPSGPTIVLREAHGLMRLTQAIIWLPMPLTAVMEKASGVRMVPEPVAILPRPPLHEQRCIIEDNSEDPKAPKIHEQRGRGERPVSEQRGRDDRLRRPYLDGYEDGQHDGGDDEPDCDSCVNPGTVLVDPG